MIALGVFDQDVSARFCLKVGPPAQYVDSFYFHFCYLTKKEKFLSSSHFLICVSTTYVHMHA